jgi:hypothetical protein
MSPTAETIWVGISIAENQSWVIFAASIGLSLVSATVLITIRIAVLRWIKARELPKTLVRS